MVITVMPSPDHSTSRCGWSRCEPVRVWELDPTNLVMREEMFTELIAIFLNNHKKVIVNLLLLLYYIEFLNKYIYLNYLNAYVNFIDGCVELRELRGLRNNGAVQSLAKELVSIWFEHHLDKYIDKYLDEVS